MTAVSRSNLDLAPPPVKFNADHAQRRRRLWGRLRAAVLTAVVVLVVAGTFLALGYVFGEAVLGG